MTQEKPRPQFDVRLASDEILLELLRHFETRIETGRADFEDFGGYAACREEQARRERVKRPPERH